MKTFPTPGQPVRGSKSGKPIMALFDLLGRSWTMGILWQLCEGGPCTFRELQKRCESISPTVLNSRLKELRVAELVEHSDEGYSPSKMGLELWQLLKPFGKFSESWAQTLLPEQ